MDGAVYRRVARLRYESEIREWQARGLFWCLFLSEIVIAGLVILAYPRFLLHLIPDD